MTNGQWFVPTFHWKPGSLLTLRGFGLVEEIDSAAESIYSYWFRQMSNVKRQTSNVKRQTSILNLQFAMSAVFHHSALPPGA